MSLPRSWTSAKTSSSSSNSPTSSTIDTPVGKYIPDWAIVKHDDDTIYMVRETKGVKKEQFLKLRTSESDKIRCGEKHFEALGVSFAMVTDADEV